VDIVVAALSNAEESEEEAGAEAEALEDGFTDMAALLDDVAPTLPVPRGSDMTTEGVESGGAAEAEAEALDGAAIDGAEPVDVNLAAVDPGLGELVSRALFGMAEAARA